MKNHTKVYLKHFGMDGYDSPPYMPCEICGGNGGVKDIHHVEARKSGGSKTKDYIENLMGLCRECHLKCEAKTIPIEDQKQIHLDYLQIQSHQKTIH